MPLLYLVDDDPLILRSIERILRRENRTIASFSTSEELFAPETQVPKLIICDYHLPRADGLDILYRARERWPEATTILLSGGCEDERILEAMQQGVVNVFMAKPWHNDELKALVAKHLCDQ